MHDGFTSSGQPAFYSIENGQLRLSPSPNGSENLVLRYYAKLDDLSADDDTNVILTNFPGIYVYGALSHHAMLIRDQESAAMWQGAYQKEVMKARAADNRYRHGSGTAMPVARATA